MFAQIGAGPVEQFCDLGKEQGVLPGERIAGLSQLQMPQTLWPAGHVSSGIARENCVYPAHHALGPLALFACRQLLPLDDLHQRMDA